jgi:hypothetical protein
MFSALDSQLTILKRENRDGNISPFMSTYPEGKLKLLIRNLTNLDMKQAVGSRKFYKKLTILEEKDFARS